MNVEEMHFLNKKHSDSLRHYIGTLVLYYQYLRIWPFDDNFPMFIAFIVTTTVITLLIGTFSLAVAEIMFAINNFSVQQFAIAITPSCLHATAFLKWMYCIMKGDQIIALMNKLNKCHLLCIHDDSGEGNKSYKEKMEQARYNSTLFIYMWTYVCVYGVIHWCFTPMIIKFAAANTNLTIVNGTTANQNILPFAGSYPWDVESFHGYISTYILQLIGALGSSFGVVGYDIFYVSILILISAQLEYINMSLVNYKTGTGILQELQNLFSPLMFGQCLETLILLCLLSFQCSIIKITMNFECLMTLWSMLEYFLGAAFQLYVFCFYATEIRFLSMDIANAVYCSGWEHVINIDDKDSTTNQRRISVNVKCLVEIIMVRAQKPIILTGGPFYTLSLETFKSIIGMAMSNSVVLRQLAET